MSGDKEEVPPYQACTWTHSRTLHRLHDQARGYERKVDRRRSKTFKSITVPEEVLEEAGAHSIVEDDEDYSEDSEEDEAEVDEYGEPGPYITIFFRRFYWDHQSANCIRIAISERYHAPVWLHYLLPSFVSCVRTKFWTTFKILQVEASR